MHPMLQQSKLQLSLGLAADKPLDLKSWGYGSTSAATRTSITSCADLRSITSHAPFLQLYEGVMSVQRAAVRPARGQMHDNVPTLSHDPSDERPPW